jgi:hypothetical protein
VAAFDLDEYDSQASEGRAAELDRKESQTRVDPSKSSLNLAGLASEHIFSRIGSAGSGIGGAYAIGKVYSDESLSGSDRDRDNVGLILESPAQEAARRMSADARNGSMDNLTKMGSLSIAARANGGTSLSTWDTGDLFSFPVAAIPIKIISPDGLTLDDFREVRHLADGSNANVFTALFRGESVIIKMIKKEVQYDPVALHEFEAEHGVLSRVSHPNIIKLLGAGRVPRRFVVLEWLNGGSLSSLLNENQGRSSFTKVFFRRPSFTYEALLNRAKEMAEALDYLHSRCFPGATIIHRDLKPDNVGFMLDGSLKLFDLGLCTCVKRRTDTHVAYEMTGNTGSLRYMAPEVALRKPYTEKVDVYSFGIMVWQMATGENARVYLSGEC